MLVFKLLDLEFLQVHFLFDFGKCFEVLGAVHLSGLFVVPVVVSLFPMLVLSHILD